MTLHGRFFIKLNGHFLRINRELLYLLQNLGGTCPQCSHSIPTSSGSSSKVKSGVGIIVDYSRDYTVVNGV